MVRASSSFAFNEKKEFLVKVFNDDSFKVFDVEEFTEGLFVERDPAFLYKQEAVV